MCCVRLRLLSACICASTFTFSSLFALKVALLLVVEFTCAFILVVALTVAFILRLL